MSVLTDDTGILTGLSAVKGEPALFGAGEPVEVSRYTATSSGLAISDLGPGTIAGPLTPGRRMEIRIRAERGLVTSPIFSVQQLSDAHLLVATTSHLYVLTRLAAPERLPQGVIDQAAEDLAWGTPVPDTEPDDITRYARIGAELAENDPTGWGGEAVRVEVLRGADTEELGLATLLEDPAPGSSLRLALRSGGVIASSGIERLHALPDGAIEAETANSTYRLVRVAKDLD
jgi:hypothetical protein